MNPPGKNLQREEREKKVRVGVRVRLMFGLRMRVTVFSRLTFPNRGLGPPGKAAGLVEAAGQQGAADGRGGPRGRPGAQRPDQPEVHHLRTSVGLCEVASNEGGMGGGLGFTLQNGADRNPPPSLMSIEKRGNDADSYAIKQ